MMGLYPGRGIGFPCAVAASIHIFFASSTSASASSGVFPNAEYESIVNISDVPAASSLNKDIDMVVSHCSGSILIQYTVLLISEIA